MITHAAQYQWQWDTEDWACTPSYEIKIHYNVRVGSSVLWKITQTTTNINPLKHSVYVPYLLVYNMHPYFWIGKKKSHFPPLNIGFMH
jgi:hypothetical protein